MMSFVLIFVVSFATYTNAAETLIPISLGKFEKTMLSYAGTMQPVFNQTYNNVYSKLNELDNLSGVQPILILATLYSQFLPAYTICKQQIMDVAKKIPKIIPETTTTEEVVLLSSSQINALENACNAIANGDGYAVTGLLDQIDAIGTLGNSDRFKYTDTTVTCPTTDLKNFVTALSGFLQGNQYLVKALGMFQAINIKTLVAQQNNQYAMYFLESLFNSFSQSQGVYTNIVKSIQTSIDGISSLVDTSEETTTLQISEIMDNVITAATAVAVDFYQGASIDGLLISEIVNPPKLSGSS